MHPDLVKAKTNKTLKNMTLRQRNYRLKDIKFKIVEGNNWLSTEKNRRTQKQLNPKTFKARAMKKTHTHTLKGLFPQTPGRRVTVIKSYLENIRSPTVSTLQNMKIVTSPEEIENTAFLVILKRSYNLPRRFQIKRRN